MTHPLPPKAAEGGVLFPEISAGNNAPVIINNPFWQMTNDNPKAIYARLNHDEACCPMQIERRSICIDGNSGDVIERLNSIAEIRG